MRFRRVDLSRAAGSLLAHSQKTAAGKLGKGHLLDAGDIRLLRDQGVDQLYVASLEADDVAEDEAAARVAGCIGLDNIARATPFTGRLNLIADVDGLLLVDAVAVSRLNAVSEEVTLATLAPWTMVESGQMVATIKIIPFAVPGHVLEAVEDAPRKVDSPVLRVVPLTKKRAGLIQTRLSAVRESVLDKTSRITAGRMASLGARLALDTRCDHDEAALAAAIAAAVDADCDPVLIAGASAIVDRRDVIPAAILRAGGEVVHFGMPVDPGNLLLLGRVGDRDVVGLPGCARSPAYNGLDMVLPRLMAGLGVGSGDIMAMGVGGLLKEFAGRPQPRRRQRPAKGRPRIGAVVLAAGSSTRMGSHNKLLEVVDGRPMVCRVLDNVAAAGIAEVVLVTGFESDRVERAASGYDIIRVDNPDFGAGLSTSLRAGVAALPDAVDGALIVLGDMPDAGPAILKRLIGSFDPDRGRAICVPVFEGKRGNPVLWSRRFFDRFGDIQGDTGARHLIGEFDEWVFECEVDDPGVHRDIDTVEQLERRNRSQQQ